MFDKSLWDSPVLDWPAMVGKVSIDVNKIDYDETLLFMFNTGFSIDYQKYLNKLPEKWRVKDKYILVRFLLRNYLFLKPEIKAEIDNFKKENFKNKVIGVHIRYTDNFRNTNVPNPSLDKYEQIIQKLVKENPDCTIFLATDNQRILGEYVQKYKNIVTTKKFFPSKELDALHYSKECSDKIRMGKDALVELYLLSECDYLVYSSYSSFACLSILLSEQDKLKTFNVENFKF